MLYACGLLTYVWKHVFNKLNNLVNSIKFTYEIESDCKLWLLDVVVHIVNKKPISNNSFVHYYYGYCKNVKISFHINIFKRF